jgi:pyrimidine-nucleoside phosphorylase
MNLRHIIDVKRDGLRHSQEELQFLARAASEPETPDYQLSAWLMAAYIRGLDHQEAAWLTQAMAESGETLDLSSLSRPWVDKHSTGGVGDKTTLVLLPLLASCGLTMVKMSGRGLGITGGTIDKLSSVPGFRTDLSPQEMIRQASTVGCALTGQTPRLAPADGTLYALRDATGTVASMPLIASSILSKKIAGGAEVIVLDIKAGSGAFMKTLEEAFALRDLLLAIGGELGLNLKAVVTDMDQPLGRAVGNALEVKEAIAVLRGDERGAVRDICLSLAQTALSAAGQDPQRAETALDSGAALQMAMHWFHAQGGDLDIFDEDDWQAAPNVSVVESPAAGWVASLSAIRIGELSLDLGGGRRAKTDQIDPRVGVEVLARVGDRVEAGQPLLRIHHAEAFEGLPSDWIKISDQVVEPRSLIL